MRDSNFYNQRAKEALIVLIEESLPKQESLKEKLKLVSNFVTNLEENDFATYLHLRANDLKYIIDSIIFKESKDINVKADLMRLSEIKAVSKIRDFIVSDLVRNL